jgi:hypothetical protein
VRGPGAAAGTDARCGPVVRLGIVVLIVASRFERLFDSNA